MTLLLILLAIAAPLMETASTPKLPTARHVYTLGKPAPKHVPPVNASGSGKTCEMCDFNNYEADFTISTDAAGAVTSITWSIRNDFEAGPIRQAWRELLQRYGDHLISKSETRASFSDGSTNMEIALASQSDDVPRIRVKVWLPGSRPL